MDSELTILVVEDDEIDLEAIVRGLKRANLANRVVAACDGIEALAVLRGEAACEPLAKPYVVLLDLNMPRMSGLEFLAALRADPLYRDAPVYVLTTSERHEDLCRVCRYRVKGYFVKPVRKEHLVQLVNLTPALPPNLCRGLGGY